MNSRNIVIYQIKNIINGKSYYGSTKNFKQRCLQHFNKLKNKISNSLKGKQQSQCTRDKKGIRIKSIELETNKEIIFNTLRQAAVYHGMSRGGIACNLRGKSKLSKNGTLRFEYVE